MTLLMRDQENLERGIEQGIERGIEQGLEQGIAGRISILRGLDISEEVIIEKLQEEFHMSRDKAGSYVR